MKAIDLLGIIGEADDSHIRDAKENRKNARPAWVGWAVLAACVALVIGGIVLGPRSGQQKPVSDEPQIIVSEDGVTLPKLDVSLASGMNESSSMIGFFIYEGHCYVFYDWIDDTGNLIGEHLGTITGMIDEWTPSDGYVDFAGSMTGDIYSVKGYDPSFMLCQKHQNGDIALFICNSGITMKYGSELYTDRLHLSEGYTAVQYETRESWYYNKEIRYQYQGDTALMEQFIRDLNDTVFLPRDQIPHMNDPGGYYDELEQYHIYFPMENGTTVELRLLKGGYVIYQGMLDLCVQIPRETYEALLAVFESDPDAVRVENAAHKLTIEDCIQNAELGNYVPSYVPDGFSPKTAEIFYYIDPETGRETGTKEINFTYTDAVNQEFSYLDEHSYWITITWAEEYGKNGWAGPMLDVSELTPDAIAAYGKDKTKGYPVANYFYSFGVWFGDVSVVIFSEGLSDETICQILTSIE